MSALQATAWAGKLSRLRRYAGAANFSASGLRRQDDVLLVIREPAPVPAFEARFGAIWRDAKPIYVYDRAVSGMEPK